MEHLLYDDPLVDDAIRAAIRRQQTEPLNAMAYAWKCARDAGMTDDQARRLFDGIGFLGGNDGRESGIRPEGVADAADAVEVGGTGGVHGREVASGVAPP